jgi:hypothetical protein
LQAGFHRTGDEEELASSGKLQRKIILHGCKKVDEPGYFFNKNNKQMSNIQKTA